MKHKRFFLLLASGLVISGASAQLNEIQGNSYAVTVMSSKYPSFSMSETRIEQATELLASFAERTGLTSDQSQERYLWTDAFAVCTFVGLAQATGEERYLRLAQELVRQVHATLGAHRSDDSRSGPLSGLIGEEAAQHPTRGGLRIGKAVREREPHERFDERLEWDRDGQYFHYLTRWMHALDVLAQVTNEPRLNRWARELAETAHEAFVYESAGGQPRMYWKMSINLSRPLVPSMGHHDPLEGFVIAAQLQATARTLGDAAGVHSLEDELASFARMVEGRDWTTSDPLGLGGLLIDAYHLAQLSGHDALVASLLGDAAAGLAHYAKSGELERPASQRLAFRELGLAVGLHAVERMLDDEALMARPATSEALTALQTHLPLRERIESFWLEPAHRRVDTWTEHRNINDVMLATSLIPSGCLDLR